MIDIVITCRGRLSHLLQSLQSLVDSGTDRIGKVIVVCYGDKPAYITMCAMAYENIVLKDKLLPIIADEYGYFNLSKARNIGAKKSTADWVMFADADTIYPEGFFDSLELDIEEFYTFEPTCSGNCIVNKTALLEYDEAINGYGGEDTDYYIRLTKAGLSKKKLNTLTALQHSNMSRVENYRSRNLWSQQKENIKYLIRKHAEEFLVPEYISDLMYKQIKNGY